MALLIEKTLYNSDVVRYHRITSFTLDPAARLATAKLGSFRNRQHRELPVAPVSSMEFAFPWSGDAATLAAEAYAHIKSLPEWSSAEDA